MVSVTREAISSYLLGLLKFSYEYGLVLLYFVYVMVVNYLVVGWEM